MSAELLALQMKALDLPAPEREYRFFPERRWRADFAWPEHKLIVEYEGGVYTQGRHVRGKSYSRDCEKYNCAVMLGWRVLRFTVDQVKSGKALETIELALEC